ncbi:MAG TPA: acyltransferase family protein [Acidimicrobiia bacterium]
MSRRVDLPHIAALDGLRGVAVAGVLLFHSGHLTGGYLGVDLFFVLSGFLITSLLLAEGKQTGSVGLGGFWSRRARRLLPALAGLLVGVVVYCLVFADVSQLARIQGDALATIGYVANWRAVATGQDYWRIFSAPSPLDHTWSLAIEEQFYLVWPLVFVGLLAWWKTAVAKAVLVTSLVLAVVSATLMVVLYSSANPSRVYYGTDTRACAILLGASLAAWLVIYGPARSATGRVLLEVAGVAGAIVLGIACATLGGASSTLYEGGFVVCGVAATIVIWSATHPQRGPLGAALSWRPLCWLGLISYGVYLWHWPVDIVVDTERVGLSGWPLFFLQCAITLTIAYVSYQFLERPIRRGAINARVWRAAVPAVAVVLAVVLVVTTSARPSAVAASPSDSKQVRSIPGLPQRVGRVLMVGDSVGLTMVPGLRNAGLDVVNAAFVGCRVVHGQLRSADNLQIGDCPWLTVWPKDLAQDQPRVVVLPAGQFDVWDVKPHGGDRWLTPGTKAWATFYASEMQRAIDVLTASGAKLVVLNLPCSSPPDGTARNVVESTAANISRVRAANAVLAQLHQREPSKFELGDLMGYLCPRGRYERAIHGVDPMRVDGVHFSKQGSDVFGRWLAPQLAS